MAKDIDQEFAGITNRLFTDEANEYLDGRIRAVDKWVEYQTQRNQPADFKALVDKMMYEPNERPPVIFALAAALWRLREIEKGKQNDDQ